MREQNQQSYYPRARLRLIVRLEEFDRVDTPDAPKTPPQFRKGKGVDPTLKKMTIQQDPKTGAWYVGSPPNATGGTPQDQSKSDDGLTFRIEGIAPTKLTVMRNGTRQADTCTATFRYLDFPLDPRAIRSMAVEAFLGTVSADDYARERAGETSSATSPGHLNSIPDAYVDSFGRPRTNLRFQGFADEVDVEFDEDGEPTVTIECTDNTSIIIDQDAPPKLTVSPTDPIDKAFADYLANFPAFRGMTVRYLPAGATPPTLKTALAKTAFKPKLGPPPAGGAGGGGAGATKFSVFDYLTDVAGSLGLLVRISGTTVIIQRPRTLYAAKFSGRDDDPFRGRILPSGRVLTNRLFVYGKNILKQSFKRKLRRPGTHNNIEVRCYSGRLGRTLAVRFPGVATKTRQKKLFPGNSADEIWKVVVVAGIEDEAALRAIAQGVYEQTSRNELIVRFQTMNLGSYGGDNADPDALDMEAGDPIDVEVDRNSTTSIGSIEDSLATGPSKFLRDLGFPAAFADAYAKVIGHVGLSSTYRVRTVSFEFSDDFEAGGSDDSLIIDIEAANFIEIRQSKDLPPGEEVEPPPPDPGTGPVQVVVQDDAGGRSGGPWI